MRFYYYGFTMFDFVHWKGIIFTIYLLERPINAILMKGNPICLLDRLINASTAKICLLDMLAYLIDKWHSMFH